MIIGKELKKRLAQGKFFPAKRRVVLTPGEVLRQVRELQELSQLELALLTRIPQSTISGIEKGKINLGVERAKVFSRALKIHPSVLLFSGWDVGESDIAA